MAQQMEDMQKLGKDALDNAVKSMTAMTKGYQAIAAELVDYSKKSVEDGSAAMEKLMAVKSVDKAFEVQTAFAKASYESAVARMTKIGELYTDLAKDMYAPYEAVFGKFAPAK